MTNIYYCESSHEGTQVWVIEGRGYSARVYGTEQDTCLMAAAPEMLAMLKAVNAAFYEAGTQKALQAVLKDSKALITKAEGRE